MTELAIRGNATRRPPHRGLGYGAGIGVVLAGSAAIRNDIEPSRVLASIWARGSVGSRAAATSPFIFRERTKAGDRTFVVSTMAATVAEGLAAWLWTGSNSSHSRETRLWPLLRASSVSPRGLPGARPRYSA